MGFASLAKGQTTREKEPVQVDYLPCAAENIPRGTLCIVEEGNVTIATTTNYVGNRVCASVESVDNSGGAAGDLNIGVVFPKVLVALQTSSTLNPGDYVKVSGTAGQVEEFVDGTGNDDKDLMVGVYRGKEGAVFARAGTTPYRETLSAGIVPEQDAAVNDIVWVELLD